MSCPTEHLVPLFCFYHTPWLPSVLSKILLSLCARAPAYRVTPPPYHLHHRLWSFRDDGIHDPSVQIIRYQDSIGWRSLSSSRRVIIISRATHCSVMPSNQPDPITSLGDRSPYTYDPRISLWTAMFLVSQFNDLRIPLQNPFTSPISLMRRNRSFQ